MKWDKFSLPQRKILENQIEQRLLPFMDQLFFETEAFQLAFDAFTETLTDLTKEAEEAEPEEKLIAKFALENLIEFRPIDTDEDQIRLRDQYTQSVLNELCRQYGIREWREGLVCAGAIKDAVRWLAGEDDFSYREISRRLGISHNKVRRLLEVQKV